jgi:hypothetical protein
MDTHTPAFSHKTVYELQLLFVRSYSLEGDEGSIDLPGLEESSRDDHVDLCFYLLLWVVEGLQFACLLHICSL